MIRDGSKKKKIQGVTTNLQKRWRLKKGSSEKRIYLVKFIPPHIQITKSENFGIKHNVYATDHRKIY